MPNREDFIRSCEQVCEDEEWTLEPGRIEIDFESGRHQSVSFEFFEFEGQALVRLHSRIGSTKHIDPVRLTSALSLNFRLPHGALAVHKDELVIVDTMMVSEADPAEIAAAFGYLAETADHYERTMFGPDIH